MFNTCKIPSVEELSNIEGKRVLVRVDFNTPFVDGALVDSFRVDVALPTIKLLLSRGAKVILASHHDSGSLKPVAEYLKKYLDIEFVERQDLMNFDRKSIFLLENLRFSNLEEANDPAFAQNLASLADFYVNEAFSSAHREHASIVGVPRLIPSYAGLRFLKEIQELSRAFAPQHPFLLIIGGDKVKTKEVLLKKFLKSADHVFVGGVLANDFLKAKGLSVGLSRLSDTLADMDLVDNPRSFLPEDVVVSGSSTGRREISVENVSPDERIVDIGGQTASKLETLIKQSGFVLWNGPLGLYEEGFKEGSLRVGSAMASAEAYTILGGGDTVSVLPREIEEKISFVSTGGGAMLQFLSDETLPGIEVLQRNS